MRWSFGVPNLRASALPPRIVLLLHSVTNGALGALAAGLGALAEHRHDELPASVRWLLCACFAVYVLVGLAGAVAAQTAAGAGLRWGALLTHSLPPSAVALFTGAFGGRLPAGTVVWLLVAAAVWGLRDYLGRLTCDERGPRGAVSWPRPPAVSGRRRGRRCAVRGRRG